LEQDSRDCGHNSLADFAARLRFEVERPRILGALLDAASQGLLTLPRVRLLPRMADFALWAVACETAFCPSGTFEDAYWNNRRAAIENVVDADPVATCVCELMAARATWSGSASDLLRAGADARSTNVFWRSAGWPKTPRTLGIEIEFGCEGRAGTRMIRIFAAPGSRPHQTVRTVCTVGDDESSAWSGNPPPGQGHNRQMRQW